MAQHDYDIANQSGANFRADLNNALDAIVSNNSGSSEPSTTFAYEWWIDTSANVLKLRNSANNAWITLPLSITADNSTSGALTVNGNLSTTGTLDVNGGEVILDADADTSITADTDDQIDIKIDGTDVMQFTNSSSDFVFKNPVQDKDIVFKGNDGGSEITALTLDMSNVGDAVFRRQVTLREALYINNADNSATVGYIHNDGNDLVLRNFVSTGNITFKTNATERARIDDAGKFYVAATSEIGGTVASAAQAFINGGLIRKSVTFTDFNTAYASLNGGVFEGISGFNPSNKPGTQNWFFVRSTLIATSGSASNNYIVQIAINLVGDMYKRQSLYIQRI